MTMTGKSSSRGGSWPIVVMGGLLLTAVTIILTITPDEDMAARATVQAILPILGTLLTGLWIKRDVGKQVDDVRADVSAVADQVSSASSPPNAGPRTASSPRSHRRI